MKIKDTTEGWEIIPEDSDEQKLLRWFLESVQSRSDQQPRPTESVESAK